jgi:hypothetical protein
MTAREPLYPNQVIPLFLTFVVCLSGIIILYSLILILNILPLSREHIIPVLHWGDVLIGLTIYLKTSIDFAIFIGRLMHKYPGWKNRIAIEIGTALGNIAGTLLILIIWDVFREVRWLMAGMIIIAALVLFRLAEDGFSHANFALSKLFLKPLNHFNHLAMPLLDKIIPHSTLDLTISRSFTALFVLSLTVPFILGADDFAGYIPLFNIVNVFGFAAGVMLGHMVLNIALFLSPTKTISAVKNPVISFLGGLAFILLALWGLKEAIHLLFF